MKRTLLFLMLVLSLFVPRLHAEGVTDVLNNANVCGGSTSTTYTDRTFTGDSGAEYALHCAGGSSSIQIRSSNSNSGIVVTKTVGTVKSIKIKFNSSTTSARILNIYGSNTAFTEPSELYNGPSYVTQIKYSEGAEQIYTFTDDYAYIGIRSSSGAIYLDEVDIVWKTGTTEPVAPSAPTFEIGGEAVTETYTATVGETVSVNVLCPGAETLSFSSPESIGTVDYPDGGYSIDVTENTTITVSGTNSVGSSESSTLTIEFTEPVEGPAAPVFTLNGAEVSGTIEVEAGAIITASTTSEGATVALSADTEEAATIDVATATATINAACTLTATATLNGITETSVLKVTIKSDDSGAEGTGAFKLFTGEPSELTAGMEVVLVYGTNAVGAVSSNKFLPATITLNSDGTEITDAGEAYIFTLEGSNTDGWKFNGPSGYITVSASGTNVNYSSTTTATVTITSQVNNAYELHFSNNTDNNRALMWRTSNSVFGHYAISDSAHKYPSIYYRAGGSSEGGSGEGGDEGGGTTTTVATPTIIVADGATTETGSDGTTYYTNPFDVTIATETADATINYSINGGDAVTDASPVTVTISKSSAITAYASLEGSDDSESATAEYKLRTGTPTFTSETATDGTRAKTITISSATTGATIYYSLDGGTTWTEYSEALMFSGEGTSYTVTAKATSAIDDDEVEPTEVQYQVVIPTTPEMEVFELVTDASTLRENDRIIFVNAIYFDYAADGETGWYSATTFESGDGLFRTGSVDPVDATEDIPTQITISEESGIQVFRLEYDTSASNADRPWLLDAEGLDKYLRSKVAKEFELIDLPETIEERQYLNVGFDISTSADFNVYNKSGSSYSSPTDKVDVVYNAKVTFNGTSAANYIRYNPNGGMRFRAYGAGAPTAHTWPVRVYRSAAKLQPPMVTVYDATVEEGSAYDSTIETFNNVVRVVITQNPATEEEAKLMYSWSATVANAPVLSEYLSAVPADAEEIQLLVDGNSVQMYVDGAFTAIDGLTTIEGTHVLRALAAGEVSTSQSLPRAINFKCAKPILSKGEGETVVVSRPDVFTIGAKLYYAYDDEEVVEGVNPVNYVDGTDVFETIDMTGHTKVKVVAYKDGYEPSDVVEYTIYTYTPKAVALQLVELTAAGKEKIAAYLGSDDEGFVDDSTVYVTNRTDDGQYYAVKESGESLLVAALTDGTGVRALIDYRPATATAEGVNVKWTTDYYVEVVDEAAFVETIGGATVVGDGDDTVAADEITGAVYVNGATEGAALKQVTVGTGDAAKTYRSALVRRGGAIGTDMLKAVIQYTVASTGDSYEESAEGQITPLLPSVYGGWYAYTYSQDAETLATDIATDFVKMNVASRVQEGTNSAVLMPTAEVALRHLNAVVTFYRPNVSDEILQKNDVYYTINFSGTTTAVEGSGLYVDRVQAAADDATAVAAEYYQFTIANVSPDENDNPTLEVVSTEYIESYSDSENYSSFVANYGANLKVEAANIPLLGQGTVEKVHIGILASGISDMRGNTNSGSGAALMYKGHNVLTAPEEVLHENDDNDNEAVAFAPDYYHVETYTSMFTDYAAYEYLVALGAGGSAGASAMEFASDGSIISADSDNELLGTYIANGFSSTSDMYVAFTPVYVFSLAPVATADGEANTVVAPLEKVSAMALAEAEEGAAQVARRVVDSSTLGSAATAPALDETSPMRHTGLTDMSAANITDLTSGALIVFPGNPVVRSLGSEEVTGVEDVAVDNEAGAVEYYNLQGIRISKPTSGVYIEKRGGKAVKVVK